MAGTLSGGQRQILAIARSLYFGAKVLILDEPTSALGVKESNKVVDQITKLKSQDINVILISHNIEQAFMLADRFFIFKGGTVIAQFEKNETSVKKLREVLKR
jgi:simple sugar transport system ATP-binding protein